MDIVTLGQQLLFNTVRIEGYNENHELISVGTSFIISHELDGYGEELFLVTNKHVIEGVYTAYLYFTHVKAGQPQIGNSFHVCLDMFEWSCHGHPDNDVDIAIAPIGWMFDLIGVDGVAAFLHKVSSNIILTPEQTSSFDASEEVVFVGYPNGLFDTKNYTPIFRRGTTATPVQLDYDGRPVFLIDASVFPGSSGSPVFRRMLSFGALTLSRLELLGVVSEVFYRTDTGIIQSEPAPTSVNTIVETREMIDLGVVVKGHLILDVLEDFWNKHMHNVRELKEYRKSILNRSKRDN